MWGAVGGLSLKGISARIHPVFRISPATRLQAVYRILYGPQAPTYTVVSNSMPKSNDSNGTVKTPLSSRDADKPVPREKLPVALQELVDDDDSLMDQIYEGKAKSTTDTNLRYAAYATRLRTILLSAHRYVAYTSDIGESFRPIAHPWLIRSAYGVSWAYLVGDVGYEGYKAYLRNQQTLNPGTPADWAARSRGLVEKPQYGTVPAVEDYRSVVLQRAVFQGVASMGLPAFTIHSIVRYSGRALKNARNTMVRTYGPIGLGLAAVPFLPYIFDKPVEHAVEWSFHKAFETLRGPETENDQQSRRKDPSQRSTVKEKEL